MPQSDSDPELLAEIEAERKKDIEDNHGLDDAFSQPRGLDIHRAHFDLSRGRAKPPAGGRA